MIRKRNDQREGVDGEAGQPHEAEPPECGEAAGDRRPERSPPVAKVDVECDPGEDDGRPITVEATDLPDDVLALLDHHLLDLGGTYGVPEAGDPIQYDELRIEHDHRRPNVGSAPSSPLTVAAPSGTTERRTLRRGGTVPLLGRVPRT